MTTRLPHLAPGRHPTPAHGRCLLELVSQLADEVWSDRPAAVHPVLAAVARCVNDRTTPHGRQALLPLAVPLLHTANAPAHAIVDHCLRTAGLKKRWWTGIFPTMAVARAVRRLNTDEALRRLLTECVHLSRKDPTWAE
ncbi:hypothetical protein [Saccharothrix sp.]|uniref:hypothetical protein n=1 Tax=Saccharothrix sp. TaxID=1873460 RepID=UPI002812848A|nr:hypothetical protein [Saccharothrix sp.]